MINYVYTKWSNNYKDREMFCTALMIQDQEGVNKKVRFLHRTMGSTRVNFHQFYARRKLQNS